MQPPAEQEPAKPRAPLSFWVRIGISVVLLAVLASNVPDLDGILPARHHALTVALLLLAVATTLVGVVLSAWRWQRVLAAFDAPVGLGTLTSHYLAGLFVGNVLPSTIGGDVLRVARCSTTTGSAEMSFASVILERLTGFIALPVLVFTGFLARPALLDEGRSWLALLIAGVTLGTLSVLLFLAGHPSIAGRFRDNENWTRFIGAVHEGVDHLRRRPRLSLGIVGTALVYQSSVVLSVALLFRTLDLPVPLAGVVAYVPAVAMMQVLPLSISGLGVREGMLVLFLHPFGVSNGQAIAVGLLWYASTLVVSMIGAPAFAVGHRAKTRVQ